MSQSVAMVNAKFKKRSITWLITAVVMLIVWAVVWLFASTPKTAQQTKTQEVSGQDLALPKSIETFEQFSKEVPPVDFSAVVRDLRNYPSEFKDKRFFQKNSKRWTVQVMDVAQNDIITSYLGGRKDDREKFQYLRYRSSDGEVRYVLTYGVMGSTQEALGAIKTVDFNLPKNVRPMPEQMQRYLDMIDNYEHHEEIIDSAPNAPRMVKLQKTRTEIPAAAPKEKPKKSDKEVPKKPVGEKAVSSKSATETATEPKKSAENKNKEQAKKTESAPESKPKRANPPPKTVHEPAPEPKPKPKPEPRPEPKPEPKESVAPVTNTASVPGSDL